RRRSRARAHDPDDARHPAALRGAQLDAPRDADRGRRDAARGAPRLRHPTGHRLDGAAAPRALRAGRPAVTIEIGEAFVGDAAEAAHLNTVLGPRDGPIGTAWATALATPSAGHAPYVVVLRPGLPVKPLTLFVNKAQIAGDDHARLTW